MAEVKPSHLIIGTTLAQDVYNEYGLLLLPAGAILHQSDIRLLESHKVMAVQVAAAPSTIDMPSPVLHWSETEAARQYVDAVQSSAH